MFKYKGIDVIAFLMFAKNSFRSAFHMNKICTNFYGGIIFQMYKCEYILTQMYKDLQMHCSIYIDECQSPGQRICWCIMQL